jgi:hypothetical protein
MHSFRDEYYHSSPQEKEKKAGRAGWQLDPSAAIARRQPPTGRSQ